MSEQIDWNVFCECECGSIHVKGESESEVAALREESEPNPWRYPSRGELPDGNDEQWCIITLDIDGFVPPAFFPAWLIRSANSDVRAWKYAPEPAPKLEDE